MSIGRAESALRLEIMCIKLIKIYHLRHVVKTTDIKQLVIIEENGIAKGIRRIVAVTGEDALQVFYLTL